MRIGIDARLIAQTGVGRYIRNLIRELGECDSRNEYVVYLQKKDYNDVHLPNNRWKKRIARVRWHTIAEQFVMPWLFLFDRLDVVHVPYFNAPIFYPKKFILTIHDLTILHFDTGKASTWPYWQYKIRRFGYRIVLAIGMKRAIHIITVSESVKHDIVRFAGIDPSTISVTYEGIDATFLTAKRESKKSHPPYAEYFLYVGNVYPHKNIELLLEAFRQYHAITRDAAKLVFIGPNDYFYKRLEKVTLSLDINDYVTFLHDVGDRQLYRYYKYAKALLFPSRAEGFGLPAVEALAAGCRVICSDIPVFRETLGNLPVRVPVDSVRDFVNAMIYVSREPHDAAEFAKRARAALAKYNWRSLAKRTITIYETA
jgi:glycosyltransferase involved in cell wall biosynthesis